MKLFEEFKLYENMWDDSSCKEAAAKTSVKHIRKPISEDVATEYDEAEVKACLDRVNNAASTEPDFDDDYGEGMIFVSVSEELLKKALRIGNRGTFQDNAPQATTVPAQAVDDMVISFNFDEDDEVALVSLMLGGEDDTYYDDICVVGWGDHIAGLSDVKDMEAAKTFFETQLVPNANKIAEDIINNSWAYYQLPDYAGITTYNAAVDESLTEEVVDLSGSPGISLSREAIIHSLLQDAAVRKGRRVGTDEDELYNWLAKEDYYSVEFSAWNQSSAYSYKDYPQHLKNSSTSISEREGIECFVGTLPEVTEVLNDVAAKGYEFEFITVSRLLITPPQKKYGFIGIDENADEVFLLSFFSSEEADQEEYQAPTIRYNKIFDEHEPFIQAIKSAKGYGIIVEAAGLRSKKMGMAEAPAAQYEIIYLDRHTEIVDEDTMDQLVTELESFTRDDVSRIHRIYGNGKPGKTIWTEEEGLL